MKTKREKFKTLILTLLILSSLLLSVVTWVNEKLWPSGYNFFSDIKEIPVIGVLFGAKETYSIPVDNLSKPQKMVVTNGEMRSVYYNSDSSFAALHSVTKQFLTDILSDEATVLRRAQVPADEWFDVLRNDELLDTKSIYMDFSLSYTPDLFSQVMGVQKTWFSTPRAIKDFIIAPLGESGTDMLFYVRDTQNGDVFKHYINYRNKTDIVKAIDKYTSSDSDTFVFSFEQNLDGKSTGIGIGVEQKVFVDSFVLLSSGYSETDIITSKNPISTQNSDQLSDLLSCFGYSQNSLRHHTGADETQYFVENYGSVKISPTGIIEYTSIDEGKGYDLFSQDPSTPRSLYETLNRAIEFSESVWYAVNPGSEFNVMVTSDLVENSASPGEYTFTLDYFFEGTPITVSTPSMKNGVEIKVKSGKIISYRHLMRRFNKTGEKLRNISMIDALNILYNDFANEEEATTVTDLFLSYIEDTSNTDKTAVWCAQTAGSDKIRRLG